MNTMTAKSERLTRLGILRETVLDPNTETWRTPVPLGYVDGGDVYEYVRANPLRLVDPSGLDASDIVKLEGGTSKELGTISLKGGGKATISIRTGASLVVKEMVQGKPIESPLKDAVLIGVKLDKDALRHCPLTNVRFIQFFSNWYYDKDNKEVPIGRRPVGGATVFVQAKTTYIDTGGNSAYYDEVGTYALSGDAKTLIDPPGYGDDVPDTTAIQLTKFDTFVVINGTAKYRVHWEARWRNADNGDWPVEFPAKAISGNEVDGLPPEFNKTEWPKGEDKAGNIIIIKNPL